MQNWSIRLAIVRWLARLKYISYKRNLCAANPAVCCSRNPVYLWVNTSLSPPPNCVIPLAKALKNPLNNRCPTQHQANAPHSTGRWQIELPGTSRAKRFRPLHLGSVFKDPLTILVCDLGPDNSSARENRKKRLLIILRCCLHAMCDAVRPWCFESTSFQ